MQLQVLETLGSSAQSRASSTYKDLILAHPLADLSNSSQERSKEAGLMNDSFHGLLCVAMLESSISKMALFLRALLSEVYLADHDYALHFAQSSALSH